MTTYDNTCVLWKGFTSTIRCDNWLILLTIVKVVYIMLIIFSNPNTNTTQVYTSVVHVYSLGLTLCVKCFPKNIYTLDKCKCSNQHWHLHLHNMLKKQQINKNKKTKLYHKKNPKMKKIRKKSECHVKKMSNHANFDKTHKSPMSNVIIDLTPS